MADDLWTVQLPTGTIRRGTLDELDAAFQAGHIDENVLVLAPNATAWTRLGELAGLDEGAAPPQAAAAHHAAAPQRAAPYVAPSSLRPMAADIDERAFERPRSKAGIVVAVVAIAAVSAGAIFTIARAGGASSSNPLPVAAAVAATPPPPPATTTEPPQPEKPRLTEEQKQTVLANDAKRAKQQEEKAKAREAAAAKAAGRHYKAGPQIEFGPKSGGACRCQHGDPLCTCL